MTGLGKVIAAGALVAVPLAMTAIPEQPAKAQVFVSPYAYPYACNPYYAACGYGWYGYPAGWGWGWGGWYGRGWGHGGWGHGGFRGGVRGGFHGGGHGGGFRR